MNPRRLLPCLFVMVLIAGLAGCVPPAAAPTPTATAPITGDSARMTAEAWNAYNASDYALAIEKAQECIDTFGDQALEMQGAVAAPPKTGAVSEAEQAEIHKNWALNDVGASYYIQGVSYQALEQNDAARTAYEQCRNFSNARVWDPDGKFFWSPLEGAEKALKKMDQ